MVQFTSEPCSSESPVTFDGAARDPQNLRRLFNAQASEVTQLNELCQFGFFCSKLGQCRVKIEQPVNIAQIDDDIVFCQFSTRKIATAFKTLSSSCMTSCRTSKPIY